MKKYYFFFSIIFALQSCSETPQMAGEFEVPKTNRVVLIEDLTGVRCPNCPKGAAAIEEIIKKFEGKVAAVAIHGNFLTAPLPESKYDFRNAKARELEEFLKSIYGKPAAHINRRHFDGEEEQAVTTVELWQSYIEQELNKEQEMEIVLNKSYDNTQRTLTLNVSAASLVEETGVYKISVYIIENNIEDVQETQGSIIEDYEHNHVLRDMLTNAKGDDIATSLQKNQTYSKSYTYTVPANFNIENMEAVVAISRANGDDRSVLQAKAIKIK